MTHRIWDRRLFYWLVAALVMSAAFVGTVSGQAIDSTNPPPTPTPDSAAAASSVVSITTDAAQSIAGTAQALWVQLAQPPQSDLARALLIVGGLVLLVGGWLVYEWIILIAGFLIGATAALALISAPNTLIALLVFLVGGVVGAALGALLYYVAVFLIGGYVGIIITEGIAAALGLAPVSLVAVIVGLILGGIILLLLSAELLIIFSAIVGAQMLALALNLSVGWMLLMALVGIVVQLMAIRTRGIDLRRRPIRRTLWSRRVAVIE